MKDLMGFISSEVRASHSMSTCLTMQIKSAVFTVEEYTQTELWNFYSNASVRTKYFIKC